jgi:hypothetical protein
MVFVDAEVNLGVADKEKTSFSMNCRTEWRVTKASFSVIMRFFNATKIQKFRNPEPSP